LTRHQAQCLDQMLMCYSSPWQPLGFLIFKAHLTGMVGWNVLVVPRQHARVMLVEAMIGLAKYTMDKYWMGINRHPPMRIRIRTLPIPVAS
jgi:hypothetical protein